MENQNGMRNRLAVGLGVAMLIVAGCGFHMNEADDAAKAAAASASEAQMPAVTPVEDAPQSTPAPIPAKKEWWAVNVSHTACFKTSGPADRIDDIQAGSETPDVQDLPDRVEVSADEGDGLHSITWTYYRSQDACQDALDSQNNLADKYR